jgi:hypothetical protein
MKTQEQIDRAKHLREEHKRACMMCATTIVVLGGFIGIYIGHHEAGFVVEAIGLYLVAMI